MAKQLLLVRHAEAAFSFPDFDRQLSENGNADALAMAQRISEKFTPQLIVSSPAVRTLSTAKYFAAAWQIQNKQLQTNVKVYEAILHQLLKVVTQLDNQFDKIALFGHNPGLSHLVGYLTSRNYQLDTCNAILLAFEVTDWQHVSADSAKVVFFERLA